MAAMTYFSDRVVSANKLIIAAAVLYAGALTFAHAASLPAYDPYGAQARIAEEQADAADPQIDAIKDRSLKMYWKCVGDFADAVHRNYGRPTDLEAAQKSVGPQCNRMAMGTSKTRCSYTRLAVPQPSAKLCERMPIEPPTPEPQRCKRRRMTPTTRKRSGERKQADQPCHALSLPVGSAPIRIERRPSEARSQGPASDRGSRQDDRGTGALAQARHVAADMVPPPSRKTPERSKPVAAAPLSFH